MNLGYLCKHSSILAAVAAGFVGFCPQTQANFITGEIEMTGVADLNSTTLLTATQDNANYGVVVAANTQMGAYATVPNGESVPTFNGFKFSGAAVSPLWQFAYNGWTYGFDLTSDHISSQSTSFLDIAGTGTLYITGSAGHLSPYTPTSGNWSFSITSATGKSPSFIFGFVSSDTSADPPVPDGGSAGILLSGTLVLIGGVRRIVRR